jgi:hypothetical protein
MSRLARRSVLVLVHQIFTMRFCKTDCRNIKKNLLGVASDQSLHGRNGIKNTAKFFRASADRNWRASPNVHTLARYSVKDRKRPNNRA